ncbi:MAG: hypothetical protein J6I64_09605, partial [Lachnospiraceae bacterium]|nr:hypothetical protein [Lachnospiraceae bacterium]
MSGREKKNKISWPMKASLVLMGSGQLMRRQYIKGGLYLTVFAAFLWYMLSMGLTDIQGFFTLGTVEADPWLGTTGDDSVIMLLRGLLAFVVVIAACFVYCSNVRDILNSERLLQEGKEL